MAPAKPGQRARGTKPRISEPGKKPKQSSGGDDLLTFAGLPRAMWVSARYAKGLEKQAEILKRKLRNKAGGDEVEMQSLEREILMTEEELDLERSHLKNLEDMRQEFEQEDDFLDDNEEIKNIREGPEYQEFWEAMDEIKAQGGHPEPPRESTGVPELEAPVHPEMELRRVNLGTEIRGAGEVLPFGANTAPSEVLPFGAQVNRVMNVTEKFMPEVNARLKSLGINKLKALGWVSSVAEDGTKAFFVSWYVVVRDGTGSKQRRRNLAGFRRSKRSTSPRRGRFIFASNWSYDRDFKPDFGLRKTTCARSTDRPTRSRVRQTVWFYPRRQKMVSGVPGCAGRLVWRSRCGPI
jgi:hypothetical protein